LNSTVCDAQPSRLLAKPARAVSRQEVGVEASLQSGSLRRRSTFHRMLDGLAPGTRWEDIPEEWVCPDCGTPKGGFEMVEIDYAPGGADLARRA
jgi:rubrerythrin